MLTLRTGRYPFRLRWLGWGKGKRCYTYKSEQVDSNPDCVDGERQPGSLHPRILEKGHPPRQSGGRTVEDRVRGGQEHVGHLESMVMVERQGEEGRTVGRSGGDAAEGESGTRSTRGYELSSVPSECPQPPADGEDAAVVVLNRCESIEATPAEWTSFESEAGGYPYNN